MTAKALTRLMYGIAVSSVYQGWPRPGGVQALAMPTPAQAWGPRNATIAAPTFASELFVRLGHIPLGGR